MASLVFYIGKSVFYMFFYMDFYIIEILPPITGSSIEASLLNALASETYIGITHLLAMHLRLRCIFSSTLNLLLTSDMLIVHRHLPDR